MAKAQKKRPLSIAKRQAMTAAAVARKETSKPLQAAMRKYRLKGPLPFTQATADYFSKLGKLLDAAEYVGYEQKASNAALRQLASEIKGRAPVQRTQDPKALAVVKSLQVQARRYVNRAYADIDLSIKFLDASDLLNLALGIYTGNKQKAENYSYFDTIVRDDLSEKTWNYIEDNCRSGWVRKKANA